MLQAAKVVQFCAVALEKHEMDLFAMVFLSFRKGIEGMVGFRH